MLQVAFTVLLSFLPCILWLIYFHRQDRYDPEPFKNIAITFLLGVVSTLGALAGNEFGASLLEFVFGQSFFTETLTFFLVIGPVEEGVKFLSVYYYAYRRPEFDEPVDGVVYSATAALGFAAAENVLYVYQHGTMVLFWRGLFSNLGHAVFAAFWGLAMSRSKAMPNIAVKRLNVLLSGWLLAALFHGAYDSILNLGEAFGVYFGLPLLALMVGLFAYLKSKINWFVERSPHKEGTKLLSELAPCPECGLPGISGQFCQSCGAQITTPEESRFCVKCNAKQRPGASFCNKCGASLLRAGEPDAVLGAHFAAVDRHGKEEIAYVLDEPRINIGKTLDNQFVVDDPSVSKRHARVERREPGRFTLIDLGSVNGTFVNGKRVVELDLRDGCDVRFGSISFTFRAGASLPVPVARTLAEPRSANEAPAMTLKNEP